jgi:hypothetical protein
MKKIKAEEKG